MHTAGRVPGSTTRLLLEGLERVGLTRGLLLDVGSGVGVLTFELLGRGMTNAVGVDLSAAHAAAASAEALRRGFSESATFIHGDFVDVAGRLAVGDIVTLDRVVCCYTDHERLLDQAARHANRLVALSYPRDLWYVQAWIALQNVGRRMLRNSFRTFVHSAAAMEERIGHSGFELVSRTNTRVWCVDIYVRS